MGLRGQTNNGGGESQAIPQAGFLNAEARRTLDRAVYASNRVVTVQMPRDTVVKRLIMNLTAAFDVTYSSGSPVLSELGFFSQICPQVEVNINGSRVVKSCDPQYLRMVHAFKMGKSPRRATLLSAAAATSLRASREWVAGTLAYAPTTEFMLINESVPMAFEFDWGYSDVLSRSATELDIRDVASADLKFYFGDISAVQRTGVGATVVYGNQNIFIDTQIIENRAKPRPQAGSVLFDYCEFTTRKQTSAEARGQQLELQTGNILAGITVGCRNGDTNRTPRENLLKNLTLRINGSNAIQGPVSHKDLQDDNQARYGIDDDMGLASYLATIASVADVHPMRGFAHMNLIKNGDWNTGINTSRAAQVDTIKLEYDTPAASGLDAATYTNPVEVTAHTHEIRPFAYSS